MSGPTGSEREAWLSNDEKALIRRALERNIQYEPFSRSMVDDLHIKLPFRSERPPDRPGGPA